MRAARERGNGPHGRGRPTGATRSARHRSIVVGALLTLLAVWLLPAAASAAVAPDYRTSFGPDGTEATGFGKAAAIAVDEGAEVVYVIDHEEGSLLKFDLEGQPVGYGGTAPNISGNEITGLALSSHPGKTQVAVDQTTHEVYVTSGNAVTAFQADGEPAEFTAGPGAGTNAIGGFLQLSGVAVDVNGTIYASDYENDTIRIFGSAGEPITQIPWTQLGGPANLAVDTNGTLYVNKWSGNVRPFTPSAFPVGNGTSYSEAGEPLEFVSAFSVAVDPTTNDVYLTHTTANPGIVRFNEAGELMESFAAPSEEGELSLSEGVGVHGAAETVFAANAPSEGLSQVEIFGYNAYVGPPLVERAWASGVAADSALLHAEINPGSRETTYRFEYGPADCSVNVCTSAPVGGAEIGDGDEPIRVSQVVSGLQPETTYHYRVVAENEEGAQEGPGAGDHVFTTQLAALGFQLIDSRVWEMASPPNKQGGILLGNEDGLIQASETGDALAYLSRNPIVESPQGNRSWEAASALARRGATGWASEDIMPPNELVSLLPLGYQGEYRLFSPDLERSLVEPLSGTALSPQASERTPYLRRNTDPALYTPLATGKEGFANVPPGTEFGGDALPGVNIVGSNPSLDHIVLGSRAPLTGGEASETYRLFEWAAGQLRAVSVLPDAEGGTVATGPTVVGSDEGSLQHAVSDDGSRIFWSKGDYSAVNGNHLTGLYVWDAGTEESVRLDVVKGGTGAGTANPIFQGANPAGTVAFFTDSQQLTPDASPAGADLYRCEIPAGAPAAGCSTLTDVTAPAEGSGESAEVQGILSGLADDASSLYFVAKGVLDGAPNGSGESAVAGEPNLYRWDESAGVFFIATLAPEDSRSWGVALNQVGVTFRISAASSPNGRYLAFMSQRSLTGYDNREAAGGEPAQEVFRYDTVTDQLDCVSCNPTDGAPNAFTYAGLIQPLFDARRAWEKGLLAAVLPQPPTILNGSSLYRPRFMLDNGRVFFNAFDSLVAGDSNGEWDVYQYESVGVGDCTASAGDPGTSRSGEGCVSLMSSGTAEGESAFLDAGASGDDVFFLTDGRLSALDADLELDVYDARVDGVPARLEPIAECLGEACQPAAQAPNDPTPASAAFHGAGNLRPLQECGAVRRRAGKLARGAEALRRRAAGETNPKTAEQMRRKARSLSRKAEGLGKQAKRCERNNRRAGR